MRTKATPVVVFDEALQQLVADMTATMYEASGIGLAATQVNVHQQIVVIDVSDNGSMPQVFITPAIKVLDEVLHEYEEGCLSVLSFTKSQIFCFIFLLSLDLRILQINMALMRAT